MDFCLQNNVTWKLAQLYHGAEVGLTHCLYIALPLWVPLIEHTLGLIAGISVLIEENKATPACQLLQENDLAIHKPNRSMLSLLSCWDESIQGSDREVCGGC